MTLRSQRKSNDCGPTCFSNLLSILGYSVTIKKANTLCRLQKDGTDSDDLACGFNRYGFDVKERNFYSQERAWEWLIKDTKRGQPVILSVDGDSHWTLVLRAGDKTVQMFDPNDSEPTLITKKELVDRWEFFEGNNTRPIYQGLSIIPFRNKSIKAVTLREKLLATIDVR